MTKINENTTTNGSPGTKGYTGYVPTEKYASYKSRLAKIIKNGYRLKSIKLKKINKKYYIKEGRLRFWAYVIAYGFHKKIRMLEE